MTQISVSADRDYIVNIGISWIDQLEELAKMEKKVLLVFPSILPFAQQIVDVADRHDNVFTFPVPDGEGQKDISVVTEIWSFLGAHNFTRSDLVVGIGGGATTDMAGFVAATWLRGLEWFAFPTTLAGMVDASVGGKTAINSASGKNLIGSFHSPSAVFVDLDFLTSLPDRDFAAGLAEVIKTGFIADSVIIDLLSQADNVQAARAVAQELVERSIAVKAKVVSADFREGKLREILNYGHTLGHAIEKFSHYSLRHGEAVAIGLCYIAELSHISCKLDPATVALHRTLLNKFGLPTTFDEKAWPELRALMSSDKKARGDRVRFVGISAVGQPQWIESADEDQLRQAYERISS